MSKYPRNSDGDPTTPGGWREEALDLRAKLQAAEERITTLSICELGGTNQSVKDYIQHWESRAEAAERENSVIRGEASMGLEQLRNKLKAAEAENVKAYEIGLAHSQAERLRLSDQVKNLQDELAMYKLHTTAEFIDALHQRRVIPESGGHIESTDCWCGPTVEEHPGGTLIIHNQTH